jgi:hypothetical protein
MEMKDVPFHMQEDMEVICECLGNILGMQWCGMNYQESLAKVIVHS